MLGQYLNFYLDSENDILTVYNRSAGNCKDYSNVCMNLTDAEKLRELFKQFKPEAVIHTAAVSRPEECDSLPFHHVMEINYYLNEHLVELSNEFNSRFIFTSTDLVYNGDTGGMLDENSKPEPKSLYARTKTESENFIRNKSENYLILRTSLLYGIGLNGSSCSFHNMLQSFKKGERVRLFYDQFRTPLSLHNAASIIKKIISSDIKNQTVNFGGREKVSRYELGEMVCSRFNFDKSLIERTSLHDFEGQNRVYDVSMKTDLLRSFGFEQESIEESIEKIYIEFQI